MIIFLLGKCRATGWGSEEESLLLFLGEQRGEAASNLRFARASPLATQASHAENGRNEIVRSRFHEHNRILCPKIKD
jgi:hypothetical protein